VVSLSPPFWANHKPNCVDLMDQPELVLSLTLLGNFRGPSVGAVLSMHSRMPAELSYSERLTAIMFLAHSSLLLVFPFRMPCQRQIRMGSSSNSVVRIKDRNLDKTYTHLPAINVQDIINGYKDEVQGTLCKK
jgi:hypothetical protein